MEKWLNEVLVCTPELMLLGQ